MIFFWKKNNCGYIYIIVLIKNYKVLDWLKSEGLNSITTLVSCGL